jgi:1,4-alpha-glucan branching enzyme
MFLGKLFFLIYNHTLQFFRAFITHQTEKEFIMAKTMTKCCPTASSSTSTCDKTSDFKFYAPQAKKVELGGDFNNWKANKNPLTKDASGNWKTSLKLKSGRYQYRYLVDGIWQNAQEPVECVPNAFGSWNCVVEVKK